MRPLISGPGQGATDRSMKPCPSPIAYPNTVRTLGLKLPAHVDLQYYLHLMFLFYISTHISPC